MEEIKEAPLIRQNLEGVRGTEKIIGYLRNQGLAEGFLRPGQVLNTSEVERGL